MGDALEEHRYSISLFCKKFGGLLDIVNKRSMLFNEYFGGYLALLKMLEP